MKKILWIWTQTPCICSRQFVAGPSKLDNEGPHKPVETANNFEFMYSWQRISQNSFPKFIHIFPKSFELIQSQKELRNKYDACAWDRTGAPNDVIVKI